MRPNEILQFAEHFSFFCFKVINQSKLLKFRRKFEYANKGQNLFMSIVGKVVARKKREDFRSHDIFKSSCVFKAIWVFHVTLYHSIFMLDFVRHTLNSLASIQP